ncbi:B3 domain-containing protein Os01g0234100-like isoform X1 [Cucumis melo]|uniref:B3 domain-containing protein Os01g0234100-like isoform X1 n=1 Tax=Cucumis melo TaxID=3656 RepID=A0A1S3C220_CUCME|nr:B3 domain-containing protein Os01g0234100-like isoform X1 [Cucumis melo]
MRPHHSISSPAMAIVHKHTEITDLSSSEMNQWRPGKKEKLFRRKTWVSSTQPSTSYDQDAVHSFSQPRSVKLKRTTVDSLYHDLEAQSVVMARAKEVQAKLSPSHPSLIKVMLPSHVTGGFWLGLPKGFCDIHLPKQDTAMVLEDENGKLYETKYLSDKTGLSAGWRGFSIAHKLLQGDVIVFHLVLPNKFMVYIVRSNSAAKVDGALGLKYEASNKQTPIYSKENIPCVKEEQITLEDVNAEETNIVPVKEETEEDHNPVSLPMDIHDEREQTNSHVLLDTEMMPVLEESENERRSCGSNSKNGIRLSDSRLAFDKVNSLDDFIISVNGLIIDSEFSNHIRAKYYELCCSQKSFLHDHILEGLNYKLVSGIISETVNIADAIRASKVTTSQEHLVTWDKTLTAFEGLGMNVGFLRVRINQLLTLSLKPEKKKEAEMMRDSKQEELHILLTKIMEGRTMVRQLEAKISSLDTDIKHMDKLFKEVASAPWCLEG